MNEGCCSCHINPPCDYCVNKPYCPKCEEPYDYDEYECPTCKTTLVRPSEDES